MVKTMYIQTDEVGRITDIISMPHPGYEPTEVNLPLPPAILGGAYELRNGMILYHREWDTNKDIEQLNQTITDLQLALVEVYERGVVNG